MPKLWSTRVFCVNDAWFTYVSRINGEILNQGSIRCCSRFAFILNWDGPRISGERRYTFGQPELLEGLDFVVVAIGLFGVSEILLNAENKLEIEKPAKIQGVFPNREVWLPTFASIRRGTVIGMVLGLIPEANSVIASLISYSVEKKRADPSRFGNSMFIDRPYQW